MVGATASRRRIGVIGAECVWVLRGGLTFPKPVGVQVERLSRPAGMDGAANNFSRFWAQRSALAVLKTSHLATCKVNFLMFSLNYTAV